MSTWVKLVDSFPDHPKVIAAGDEAGWLYVCGLCFCSRHLTDGFIPTAALGRLTGFSRPKRLADRLVEHGLWDLVEGGWQVHDYGDVQRTKAQAERDRDQARIRQQRSRESRRDKTVSHDEVRLQSREEESRDNPLAAPPPTDDLATAIADACRMGDLTPQALAELNTAAAGIRTAKGSPTDVPARARAFRTRYPDATLTPSALAKHWPSLNGHREPGARCQWCANTGNVTHRGEVVECNHREDPRARTP